MRGWGQARILFGQYSAWRLVWLCITIVIPRWFITNHIHKSNCDEEVYFLCAQTVGASVDFLFCNDGSEGSAASKAKKCAERNKPALDFEKITSCFNGNSPSCCVMHITHKPLPKMTLIVCNHGPTRVQVTRPRNWKRRQLCILTVDSLTLSGFPISRSMAKHGAQMDARRPASLRPCVQPESKLGHATRRPTAPNPCHTCS